MNFASRFLAMAMLATLAMAPPAPLMGQTPEEWRAPGPAGAGEAHKPEKKSKKSKAKETSQHQSAPQNAPESEQASTSTSAPVDSQQALQAQPSRPAYRIGTGDKLKVAIYNNEKLSGEYPVGGDGKIGLPMLGRVAVGGLTLDEVTAVLVGRLADGYFLNPNVTVDMAEYRPVYILGEVQKPGQYPYAEGMTVYRLVAQAGGYSYRANRKKMDVRHDSQHEHALSEIREPDYVQPGDTIIVRQRYF